MAPLGIASLPSARPCFMPERLSGHGKPVFGAHLVGRSLDVEVPLRQGSALGHSVRE